MAKRNGGSASRAPAAETWEPWRRWPIERLIKETADLWGQVEPGAAGRAAMRLITATLNAKAVPDERQAALLQLDAVLDFLHVMGIDFFDGTEPLYRLRRALQSLDLGHVETLLQPSPGASGRPVSIRAKELRALAAAAAEFRFRAGDRLEDACAYVADWLDRAGLHLLGRDGSTISGDTVRAWRAEASRSKPQSPLGRVYRGLTRGSLPALLGGSNFTVSPAEVYASASEYCLMLAVEDQPPAPASPPTRKM